MATNETIKLKVSSNQESVPLNVDSGSPYYVGARAYVTQLEDGAEITVIDKEGTTTATVHDGDTGADGYSPTATVAKSDGTTTITITDKNGTTTAEVHDGVDSVTDVKVDGSSVVSSGVATIPKASANAYGVVKVEPPTDAPDAYPTENDRIYARIFSDGEVSRVPTLVKTTGLVDSKYLPKAKYNSFGVVKAGYNGEPPAGYLRVVTGEAYNSEVCVPALQTNNTPDPSGTIRPRHLPDATTTAKGAMSASDKAKLDSIGSGVPDGGTTGQVLSKASGTDYDLEWVTPSGGGGTITDVEVDGTSVVTGGVAEIDLTGKSDVGHTHTKSAITDFPTTVSSFTNDSGFITSADLPKEYDFASTLTPSIDSRGVFGSTFAVYPTNANDMTILNTMKVKAYLIDTYGVYYPLTVSVFSFVLNLGYIKITLKSHYGNPQNTSSSTVSGTLHIVAPFEIRNVTTSK